MKLNKLLVGSYILLASCSGKQYERYTYGDNGSQKSDPTEFVFFNHEKHEFYKVAQFSGSYEIMYDDMNPKRGDRRNTVITPGYYLFNGSQLGYNFKERFDSFDEAEEMVSNTGSTYIFKTGKYYDYHDGALYDTDNNKRLNKQ